MSDSPGGETRGSARLVLGFSCVAHAYSHMFAPIFFVVALALEDELAMTHGQVTALVVGGTVLFGLMAPVAGWLGDVWRSSSMMTLFFLGTGCAMIMTGLVDQPMFIALWLAATGAFASIYHPVGTAWLLRNAERQGMALGVVGVFGGVGPAVATLMAGALTDWWGWRSAFIVPGLAMLITGAVFHWCLHRGIIVENREPRHKAPAPERHEMVRVLGVLLMTMLCGGLVYQSVTAGMPKLFQTEMPGDSSDGVLGVGTMVALVYLIAGAAQVVAGMLADRYSPRLLYLCAFILEAPLLWMVGQSTGYPMIGLVMMLMVVNGGALPPENMLLARYTPQRWHGFVFGMKFIIALGIASLGVRLEGYLYDLTQGFTALFTLLAAVIAGAVLAIITLPASRPAPAVA